MSVESNGRVIETAHGPLDFTGRCLVMGILNITPDSFSDGGDYQDTEAAVARVVELAEQGADVIDIGGESTRPGAVPVEPQEQIRRVEPVIRGARASGVTLPISIDTRSARVAAAAVAAGADIVNDVSGLRHDRAMADLVCRTDVPFVVMHMLGTPETMQDDPSYGDVVHEVWEFFESRAVELAVRGIDTQRMIVDPGLGFGKTMAHNLEILQRLGEMLGQWPVLVGASRKAFLGKILDGRSTVGRLPGSLAVAAHCALAGAAMVRVHDVRETRDVVEVCRRIRNGE